MNKLKEKLKNNEITFGAWMQIPSPAIAEILSSAGFDWICVDLEHGSIDIETMVGIFRAIEQSDCVPVVRIPKNDYVWIHRSLDAGAKGIIIPMIKSAEEAEFAIQECKYPPFGKRSFGYSRSNKYGANFENSIHTANDEISIILQIEHYDAIKNIDKIFSVEGFDATLIGPLDLRGSLPGHVNIEGYVGILENYLRKCRQFKINAGEHIVRPNESNIKKSIMNEYKFVALGTDAVFLEERSKEVLENFI
jgi:2-dehydro-3-deoxyglucarate aldolase